MLREAWAKNPAVACMLMQKRTARVSLYIIRPGETIVMEGAACQLYAHVVTSCMHMLSPADMWSARLRTYRL